MDTSEPDQVVNKMRTREQEGDAARTMHYVNAFAHVDNDLPLLSVGYEASVTSTVSSAPLQSRVSVWGQGGMSTSGYARPPVTFWGGGQWGEGGALYESATTEKVDDGAIWVHNVTDFGRTSRAACFSDATADANPVYQSLEMRDLKTTDISVSQLGTLDQIVNDSSRNRSSLPYSLEPEAVSSQSKGMLGRSNLDTATYASLDLSAQTYNSFDTVRRPLQPGSRFQSEDLEQLETGHAVSAAFERKGIAGDTGVAMSNELVLERIGNYTLEISRAMSTNNSDNILTASAHLQPDCRYHLDTSPLVVVGSGSIPDHHLSVNSFENANHVERLPAYFGNPRDNYPRVLDPRQQGNIATGADHDINDITSLLLPRSAMSMAEETVTSVSGSTNFPNSLSRNWDTTPGQLDSTQPDHSSPTQAGDGNCDLDLVELVAHPLQDQTPFLAKVKNHSSSYLGVSSSVCTVPAVSGDGKEIRAISFHSRENSLAEASLYDICSKMRSKWQLGCIALAHR